MSQNSLVHPTVGTYGGPAMVAAMNAMNDSLNGNQSGAAAPGSAVAGSDWFDTTNKIVKRNNSAAARWLTRQDWDSTPITATSALSGDNLGVVLVDATAGNIVLTIPPPTIGKAAMLMLKRIDTSSNTVTVVVSGATNFRMLNRLTATSLSLSGCGDFASVASDGVTYWDVLERAPLVLIQSQTGAAVSSIDFTTGINPDFAAFKLMGNGVIPGTNSQELWLRFSEDAGATWKSGAADYTWFFNYAKDNNTGGAIGSAAAVAQLVLAQGIGNAGAALGGGIDFDLNIFNPSNATMRKRVAGVLSYLDGSGTGIIESAGGTYRGTTNAINGVRVMASSGTLSGTVSLFGVRK